MKINKGMNVLRKQLKWQRTTKPLPTFLPHRNATCKKKGIIFRDSKVVCDWHLEKENEKKKNFEKNVKNYSASGRESRTDESPAINNPQEVSQDCKVFITQPVNNATLKGKRRSFWYLFCGQRRHISFNLFSKKVLI